MAESIDIRELYLSIANSLDDANQQIGEDKKGEFSYAITDLEFSVPFKELIVKNNRIWVSLAKKDDVVSEIRNIKFKVRCLPKMAVRKAEEEKPEEPGTIVPDVLNKLLDDAIAQIKERGLSVGEITYKPVKGPPNHIISQIPIPLHKAKPGQKVDLVVSGEAPRPKAKEKKQEPKKKKESKKP